MGKAIKEFKHEMAEVTDGGKDAAKLAPPAGGSESE
jgi:Sec-independent protein translocase protein TatA